MAGGYLHRRCVSGNPMGNNLTTKKQVFQIVALAIVCAWVLNIFAGRYLTAKISTLPLLNKWKILNPQAPIVINNREVVRVAGPGEFSEATAQAKSKLGLLVTLTDGKAQSVAGAVNLTSDGYFATARLSQQPGSLAVVLSDGRNAPVTQIISDPAADVSFVKADIQNVPVASLAKSADLALGEQIIFVVNSLQSFESEVAVSFVTATQKSQAGRIYSSDSYTRAFAAQPAGDLLPGQAIVNVKGEIVGLWNGAAVVSSDVLKGEIDGFFSAGKQFVRPRLNFKYQTITGIESDLLNIPSGARVVEAPKTQGQNKNKAALETGDIITAVNGNKVSQENPLETLLLGLKPNQPASFTVWRDGDGQTFNLTPGELKE